MRRKRNVPEMGRARSQANGTRHLRPFPQSMGKGGRGEISEGRRNGKGKGKLGKGRLRRGKSRRIM